MSDEGWMRRTIADEPRLSELIEMYKELEFETKVQNLTPEDFEDEMCNECMKMNMEKYKVIYTRANAAQG